MAESNPLSNMPQPPGWPAAVKWPPPVDAGGRIMRPTDWPANLDWTRAQAEIMTQASVASRPPSQTDVQTPPTTGSENATPTSPTNVTGNATKAPPWLESSQPFQRHVGAYVGTGGKITRVQSVNDAAGNPTGSWMVEYTLADGKSTISVNYTATPNGVEATGSAANIQTAAAQETALRAAQTDLAQAQRDNVDEETRTRRMQNAQRAANAAKGQGAVLDTEVAQINSANAGAAATVANAQAAMANVDLNAVRAMTEVLQQKGYAANQAYQIALDYAVKQANVDQANTNTVVNAATSLLNNDTTLANARLNAANSGFSSDVQQAMALNEYMPIGSDKAADVLLALTGLRQATAGKAGAYRNTEPGVLTQLGRNTPVRLPGLDYDAVMAHANALQERGGVMPDAWPSPEQPFGGKYVERPAAHTSAGSAGQVAAATGGTFKPITWDTGTRGAAPTGSPQLNEGDETVKRAQEKGGGRALSKVGEDGMVWISDPTAPGGRRLISHRNLPAQPADLDVTTLPEPTDHQFVVPPGEVSRFDPGATQAAVAQANLDRQNQMLAEQERVAERERQRRLQALLAGGNPYDSMADGTQQPYEIPYFL
jgi:hypothetical protein